MRESYNWHKTPKPTEKATKCDVAWAAGFMEGEGSFGKSVSACQINKEPLIKLQKLFGGRLFIRSGITMGGEDIWIWRVGGKMAKDFTKKISPYLSEKRKNQAKKAGYLT